MKPCLRFGVGEWSVDEIKAGAESLERMRG